MQKTLKKILAAMIICGAVINFFSCEKNEEEEIVKYSFIVDKTTLYVGDTAKIKVSSSPKIPIPWNEVWVNFNDNIAGVIDRFDDCFIIEAYHSGTETMTLHSKNSSFSMQFQVLEKEDSIEEFHFSSWGQNNISVTLFKNDTTKIRFWTSPLQIELEKINILFVPEDIASLEKVEEDGIIIKGLNYGESTLKLSYGGASAYVKINVKNKVFSSGVHMEHEYVDFDLPSGTYWATCNIGATVPEEKGEIYRWGETEVFKYYEKYKFASTFNNWGSIETFTKYNKEDNKTKLDEEDDVASRNWKGKWKMPTKEDCEELIKNCVCYETQNYRNTGIKGIIYFKTTKSLDKGTYYYPEGYLYNDYLYNDYLDENYENERKKNYDEDKDVHIFIPCEVWTRSLYSNFSAYFLYKHINDYAARTRAYPIRAVCK